MLIPIENLGSIGIVQDPEPREIPQNAWSSGINVAFQEGIGVLVGGYEEVYTSAIGNPLYQFTWIDQGDLYWLYAGTDFIARVQGSTHEDITRASGVYHASGQANWSGGILGGVPIMNNASLLDYPQQWDVSTSKMKDLSNWPSGLYAQVVRPFGVFLVALGIKDGTDSYPHLIQWSAPAEPGAVPTSWDYTDPTTKAGRRYLAETTGELVDLHTLGKIAMIYKEDAVYGMAFSGGQEVMTTEKLFDKGLIRKDCVVTLDKAHFCMGYGELYLHNGQTVTPLLRKQDARWLYNYLNQDLLDHISIAVEGNRHEVWIAFPSNEGDGNGCDKIAVWHWDDNTFAVKDAPDVLHLARGIVDADSSSVIDDQDVIIDDVGALIDAKNYTQGAPSILSCRYGADSFQHWERTSQFNGVDITWQLEKLDFAIAGQDREGKAKLNPTQRKFLRHVFPKMEGSGTVYWQFGNRERLDSGIDWEDPIAFELGVDHRLDVMLNFRYLCLRVYGTGNAGMTFSGYVLDMDVLGEATL